MVRAGVRKFRIELVDEPAGAVKPLVQGYRDLLDGARTSGDLWSWMGGLSSAGSGRGGKGSCRDLLDGACTSGDLWSWTGGLSSAS